MWQGPGAGSSLKGARACQSVSAEEAVDLARQVSGWMERELAPVYGLDPKYTFGFKDAVFWEKNGCRVERHIHSGAGLPNNLI